MVYVPQEWRNDDPSTPLSAERLLHIEDGIREASEGTQGPPGAPGADGVDGQDGVSPILTAGTATTLPAGADPTVSVTGTSENPVINIGVPKPTRSGKIIPWHESRDPTLDDFPDLQVGDQIQRMVGGIITNIWKVEES